MMEARRFIMIALNEQDVGQRNVMTRKQEAGGRGFQGQK
ncbi:unnamed protein product [Ectocarpus sp. 6 AP-2014]